MWYSGLKFTISSNCILNVWYSARQFIFILVFLKRFIDWFVIVIARDNKWVYGCAPSPPNQSIQYIALVLFRIQVYLIDFSWSLVTEWYHITIGIQFPLGHFFFLLPLKGQALVQMPLS